MKAPPSGKRLIGGMVAIIAFHTRRRRRWYTLRRKNFTDKFGQIHYLLLEPGKGKKNSKKETVRCRLFVDFPQRVIWLSVPSMFN